MILPITDPLDPRIEPYRQLRERDLVGRDGLFIAEGRVVLEKAVATGRHPLISVLVDEKRLASLADILDPLPDDTPVYAASQGVMDAIAGFNIHRGVLALGRRRDLDAPTLLGGLPRQALVVVLVGIANHDNVGGVFRNAAAFGADAVLLDQTCCDPLYRKAIRVSVGAALTTPFARVEQSELAPLLEAFGFDVLALSPRGTTDLRDLPPLVRPTAALVGAEGPGLPAGLLTGVKSVRISMNAGFDSLNVATTSGILLHYLSANRIRP